MKKSISLLGFVVIASFTVSSVAMQKDGQLPKHTNELIEFEGEKKPLIGWIRAGLLNSEHPFSTTSVIRLVNAQTFVMQGDVLSLETQDLEGDIANDNYVYTPFYAMLKTRLSRGTYANVGAIILGTKDQKFAQSLHFAHMCGLIAAHRAELAKDRDTK